MKHAWHGCWLITLALAIAATAQSVDPRLTALGSPDYAERQAATAALLRDDAADPDDLRTLYLAAPGPEQRHRLLGAIRHHTLRRWRAEAFGRTGEPAIGFSHDIRHRPAPTHAPGADASAVVFVVATLPGFPGHAYLRPGDLITHIDDERLPGNLDNDAFKDRLRRHQAGETIRLTLLREDRPLRIELTLATIESLERMYTQSPQLQEPFRSRWRAIHDELLAAAPPIPTLEVPPAP